MFGYSGAVLGTAASVFCSCYCCCVLCCATSEQGNLVWASTFKGNVLLGSALLPKSHLGLFSSSVKCMGDKTWSLFNWYYLGWREWLWLCMVLLSNTLLYGRKLLLKIKEKKSQVSCKIFLLIKAGTISADFSEKDSTDGTWKIIVPLMRLLLEKVHNGKLSISWISEHFLNVCYFNISLPSNLECWECSVVVSLSGAVELQCNALAASN